MILRCTDSLQNPGSGSDLDDWLDEGDYNPGLNYLGGVFAEQCLELY